MINTTKTYYRTRGLLVPANIIIQMESTAILQALPSDREAYCILYIGPVNNVTVRGKDGAQLVGDRSHHLGERNLG